MKQNYEVFTVNSEELDCCEQQEQRELKVRLDKWLWAARFFKTRALARAAIEQGKVLYNGEKIRPSIEIQLDERVSILHKYFSKTIIIKGLSTRRKNATDALALFEELPQADIKPEDFQQGRYQNSSEHANKKPKRVLRFLRRPFVARNIKTKE